MHTSRCLVVVLGQNGRCNFQISVQQFQIDICFLLKLYLEVSLGLQRPGCYGAWLGFMLHLPHTSEYRTTSLPNLKKTAIQQNPSALPKAQPLKNRITEAVRRDKTTRKLRKARG